MNAFPSYRAILRAVADASAYRSNVPDVGAGFGAASIENGFPIETMKDIDDGGIAPKGQDMNGLLHLISSSVLYMQHGGMGFRFNQAVADTLGGYAQGAVLSFDDLANPYCVMSAVANNTVNFNTDTSVIGNTWLLVPKVMQYYPLFNYPRGYILTYQGRAYVCVTDNGPGMANPTVTPGTNGDFWELVETMTGTGNAPNGKWAVGDIDFKPNRFSELPPGWEFCNGTRFADYTPQGQALASLPFTYKTDWNITLTAAGYNVPNLIGYFPRAVDGTSRMPGSVQQDAARPVNATASTSTSGSISSSSGAAIGEFDAMPGYVANGYAYDAWDPSLQNPPTGAFKYLTNTYAGSANDEGGGSQFATGRYRLEAASVYSNALLSLSSNTSVTVTQANQSTENRPINVGLTPCIYLGA